jgi:excisionase family DNA binding protein
VISDSDILERLRTDPGKRTIGELTQDRERALHEIVKLRADNERLRTMRKGNEAAAAEPCEKQGGFRPGTLIRLGEVCEMVGVCRTTIYRWMADGTFPAAVRLGEHAVRWRVDEIERWKDAL